MTIRVDGARIYFRVAGGGEAELIAISENRFYLEEQYAEIAIHRNDRGEVDRREVVGVFETPAAAEKVPQ